MIDSMSQAVPSVFSQLCTNGVTGSKLALLTSRFTLDCADGVGSNSENSKGAMGMR